jgi:hypothetical protein
MVHRGSNRFVDAVDFFGLSKQFGITEPRLPYSLSVFSHHKCGTVWLRTFLTDVCELNGLSFSSSPEFKIPPSSEHDVSLLTNAIYHNIKDQFKGTALHVIRNPMSVVVSAYYSHLTSHPTHVWPELEAQRKLLRDVSLKDGMFATITFLENSSGDDYLGPLKALQIWNYDDQRIFTVPMEQITINTHNLVKLFLNANRVKRVELPNVENYSFEKMSGGRKVGQIDSTSHYRSGSAESWRDELPKPVQDYVRKHYSNILRKYYPDALE